MKEYYICTKLNLITEPRFPPILVNESLFVKKKEFKEVWVDEYKMSNDVELEAELAQPIGGFGFNPQFIFNDKFINTLSLIKADTEEQFLEYWDRLVALNEAENMMYIEKTGDTFVLNFMCDYVINFIQNDIPIPNEALTDFLLNCATYDAIYNSPTNFPTNRYDCVIFCGFERISMDKFINLEYSSELELIELTYENLKNYIDSQIGKTLKWMYSTNGSGEYFIHLAPIYRK